MPNNDTGESLLIMQKVKEPEISAEEISVCIEDLNITEAAAIYLNMVVWSSAG